jgi:hypothetical protein
MTRRKITIEYEDLLEIEVALAETLDVIKNIRRGTYYGKEGDV